MKQSPKYQILDDMECTVATADTWEDAIYAAQQYAPSMIYFIRDEIIQCRFVETQESVPV